MKLTDDSESEYISRIHSHNLQLFLLKSKPGNYFPLMWPYIRGFYVWAKKKKKKVLNDYHHYRKVWDGTTTCSEKIQSNRLVSTGEKQDGNLLITLLFTWKYIPGMGKMKYWWQKRSYFKYGNGVIKVDSGISLSRRGSCTYFGQKFADTWFCHFPVNSKV